MKIPKPSSCAWEKNHLEMKRFFCASNKEEKLICFYRSAERKRFHLKSLILEKNQIGMSELSNGINCEKGKALHPHEYFRMAQVGREPKRKSFGKIFCFSRFQNDLRGKLKEELKEKNHHSKIYYQHQSLAENAVNALEQRTLLDVDSEPWRFFSRFFVWRKIFVFCSSSSSFEMEHATHEHHLYFGTVVTVRRNVIENDRGRNEHRSFELFSRLLRSLTRTKIKSLFRFIETLLHFQYHKTSIENVRKAEQLTATTGRFRPLAIALDTKGPEIRTGVLESVCQNCWRNFSRSTRLFFSSFRASTANSIYKPEWWSV